jgi:nuclear pore complex protein Nup188
MGAQLWREWAGQALEETQVMLECAFLLYYDQRTKCSPARFAQLANAFEAGALGWGLPDFACHVIECHCTQ